MSICLNVDGVLKNPVNIFAGINGEKKKIKEVYIGKDGLPLLVYPKALNINNRFYLITKNCILYSNDGIEWQELNTVGLPSSLSSSYTFAYGNDVYILYYKFKGYYRSTDLINWEYYDAYEVMFTPKVRTATYTNEGFSCIVYCSNRFFAIANEKCKNNNNTYFESEEFKYSYDGIEWHDMSGLSGFYSKSTSYSQLPYYYSYSDFYYLNGTYVCKANCPNSSNSVPYQVIYYSDDGINWKASATYISSTSSIKKHYGLNTIYYFDDLFVRKYYDPADKKSFLYYSYNGKDWIQSNIPSAISSVSFDTVLYIDRKFVIPIYESGIGYTFYCSEDFSEWECESMDVLPIDNNSIYFVQNDNMLIAYIFRKMSTSETFYYDMINNSWNEFTITEYTDSDPSINTWEYVNGLFFITSGSLIFNSSSGINYLPCNINSDNTISFLTNYNIFHT